MARGRMISGSLGSSRKFHELLGNAGKLGEFAQSLYPLIVSNTDDFGRLEGDPFTIKHKVFPTSPRSESDFGKALKAMHEVGLIYLYCVDGIQCLQVENFDPHQSGLHKRTQSRFPEIPGNSRSVPEIPSELNRTEHEGNRTEENTSPPKARRKAEVAIPEDFQITDKMRSWAVKSVPTVDVDFETENFRDHARGHDRRQADWEAAWRTWMRNAVKFARNGGNGGSHKRPEQPVLRAYSEPTEGDRRASLPVIVPRGGL